ncbi:MAG: AAA family ATPase [Deltaproteobacteria bacterium]|nr:AAA family ATPase [Deltaproteobacteria bacterium]
MKCPKCQAENPEMRKFCRECGTKLILLCPKCNSENLPGDKFCGECGQDLTLPPEPLPKGLSFGEKLDKIQRYLPKGITEKILSQRDKIEGERKHVTVMFCDMEGFTPLVEKLGPEEAYSIMDQVYEILIHKVHDYEGTVNEMTGDGIMALFGAPIALEDAPQRAIRSAMAIHREMTRFNERVKQEKGDLPPVKMRVGIHTGPVVVGTLGNDLRVEFKAVGDTVNVASRMESLAEPGTTYVSDDTFKITEGLFRFEVLGEREIKGKEEPVNVYRVIAPSTRRTRFDVSTERGLTRFVGRERELELMLDGFERSREGRGQAVSIISDAGIGKSRLLYEFRKAVTNENITFLEGRCLSYSRNVAYHPIVDVLKANFDIQDNDTDQEIREKVARGLQFFKIDEASTLPYLLELLSVKESGIDRIPMSPETRKHRTLEALKRVILSGAEFRPLILAIEDLHWMDRSSEDAFKEILESISATRIFLIFTYRPEFVHTWGSRSYHSQVTLNRLSNRESLSMATHILGTPDIDRALEELILQKTEGIPFFIEEFIKSLTDLGAIERKGRQYQLSKDIGKLTIPSTIQDVIMARVDNLPEGAREVLRTGSVIEREFSHDLIKRLAGRPEQELLSHLSSLKDSELLYERGIYPESTYIFKHALTQEVVYNSILTRKRKHLHEGIANTMEEIYKDNLCDHYGVVAGHLIAGEKYEKGAEYSRLEARKTQKAGSFNDAIEYQEMSISCLERLPQTEVNQKKNIDARTTLANYHLTLGHNSEAKDAVEPVMDLALKLNYRKRLPGIYTAMGAHALWVEEDFSSGIPYINDALRISEEIGDFLSLWSANFFLGLCLSYQCEFERALSHIEKSLDLSELADNPIGISVSKAAITHVCLVRGNISLACKVGEEASNLAEESGDVWSKGWAHSQYGCSLYYKGEFDKAEEYLLEGLTYSQKTSQRGGEAWAPLSLGNLYFDTGAYGKAQDYYIRGIKTLERSKSVPSWVNAVKTDLARARARTREPDADLHGLFECFENNKFKVCEGRMARNIGDILLQVGDEHMADAEVWIRKAIEADTKNGTRWYLATDHALYADWFKKKGERSSRNAVPMDG